MELFNFLLIFGSILIAESTFEIFESGINFRRVLKDQSEVFVNDALVKVPAGDKLRNGYKSVTSAVQNDDSGQNSGIMYTILGNKKNNGQQVLISEADQR